MADKIGRECWTSTLCCGLTAIELRRLADREPATSTYLPHATDQIEGEVSMLRNIGIGPVPLSESITIRR